jgi:OmcA/MtrC family decaheme c-type cytochrome
MSTDGGAKVLTCSDGTSVTINNGAPGSSCSVTGGDGGVKTITCEDGTSVQVTNGEPGTSCTIEGADGGVKTITCEDGTSVTITNGQNGLEPLPTVLDHSQSLPGVKVQILSLAGGSGPGGNFEAGDTIAVNFTVKANDGTAIALNQLTSAGIWMSGPTSNYQHILPASKTTKTFSDVKTAATQNADGSYTYTFGVPIPATYGPPLNDTIKFTIGELTGQPLQHGTYTVAMNLVKDYTIDNVAYHDVGWVTKDFLLGSVTTLESHEVVTIGNCNSCHQTLQAHGGRYRDTKLCVTCHTAGAEDSGSTDTGDPTTMTVEFRSMMHKLHNSAHLPSVLGVGVNADGTQNWAATPVKFMIGTTDLSGVNFPVWPYGIIPMPRPLGYSALTTAQQALSDTIREGAAACDKCHGDPDGSGPLAAPAQGSLAYSHVDRIACGSCHDDIDWSKPYKKNTTSGMPAQADDSQCAVCHPASGTAVGGSALAGHVHPFNDPTFNPGLNIAVSKVAEAGTNNNDGTIDPGEKVAITFTMTDNTGAAVVPSATTVPSVSVVMSGPTWNRQMMLNTSIQAAMLTGAQPWTINLPEPVVLEAIGTSTATTGDAFTTARTPVWNVTGALPTIYVRTATGAASALASAAAAQQNFIDVQSAASFLRNDYIVVDDGVAGKTEYLRVQYVDGNRLWFGASGTTAYQPVLRQAHAAGATVTKITLATKTVTTDYTVAAATGTITEVTEFGAGNVVLASYTTDFVMPAVYGPAINESPDLGEAVGKWKGLPIVDGTYTVGLWGARALTLTANGETNSYRGTSLAGTANFLVGGATKLTPGTVISSAQNCNSCHTDVQAHGGGRRGFDACILCHGTAGSEDRPRYVAANAPATTGLTIEFRSMLHKAHMGANLTNASTFNVVGFGAGAYPNNFGLVSFAETEFPAEPAGVKQCSTCHGTSTAWQLPVDRSHPTASTAPSQSWTLTCGSCHDGDDAAAHFQIMTTSVGVESCSVCHSQEDEFPVSLVHKFW